MQNTAGAAKARIVKKSIANPFASIDSNTLNVAKTDEIFNFLNNKVAEGIFVDESNFVEIFLENGDFQVEFLNGQYKGLYRGKWKAENDSICFANRLLFSSELFPCHYRGSWAVDKP